MTVIKKGTDKFFTTRGLSFNSSLSEFATNDVLDLASSLGGPAAFVQVEVLAASSCSFKINSMSRRFPLNEDAKRYGIVAYDFANEAICLNPDIPAQDMTAGEIINITDRAISNIEFTAVVGTVIVRVWN